MTEKNAAFLIVDDEPDMCWALENILKNNGVRSQKAYNGQDALRRVKKNRFEVAFLDAKLPDIEGLELSKQIRKISPSIRIFIVSGYFYRDDPSILQAMAEGSISGFIAKPFNHDDIVKIIEQGNGVHIP